MKIYSIRNTEINYSNRPFYFESDEEAKQYILNVLCSDSDRALKNLKDVLILECIGEIDFSDGSITSCDRYFVCNLSDIWYLVPDERIPRDSVELRNLISVQDTSVKQLEEKLKKITDSLFTHFKFIRKEI